MLEQQNRQQFLEHLAAQLGRPLRTEVADHYQSVTNQPSMRLSELNNTQRCSEFIKVATEIMAVECITTTRTEAPAALVALCKTLNSGKIILNNDPRLIEYGLTQAIQQHFTTHIWSTNTGTQNRTFAEQANIGIVFAEYGLVESGGIVLYSSADCGYSTSLLPQISIAILKKSSILPRVASLAALLHRQAQQGNRMPSCINIISGPSATADIELVKVVGVHGPIKQVYVILEDL